MSAQSPFFHCNSVFDPIEVMRRHAVADLQPAAAYVTNFLGVRIAPKFFPGILDGREGTVEEIPIPANWHADIAEWGAALRAVDMAESTFRVAELGCGWGCWLNNTGVAARRRGLAVELVGIEGDKGHVAFAKEALATNGFASSEYRLIHGIAAPGRGKALFPRAAHAGRSWGLEPIFGASLIEIAKAKVSASHDVLDMVPLEDIAAGKLLDLLHIDIQGGEADYVRSCLPDMNALVRRVVIGTHSREIEGSIMTTLLEAGWRLEIERPAIFSLATGRPVITVDGVQGWANPRLAS